MIVVGRKFAAGLLFCFLLASLQVATAQYGNRDGVWRDIPEATISLRSERDIVPMRYRTVALDMNALSALLSQAPLEHAGNVRTSPLVVDLPLPDNTLGKFRVVESPIMAPELAAKYPAMRTYLGQGIDDGTALVRFDVTSRGFHAMILSEDATVYIDPYARNNMEYYISYFKEDLPLTGSRLFEETAIEGTDSETAREIGRLVAGGRVSAIGEQLRTYRLALASTGEYTAFHGGTVESGLASMVTAMNRVNGIYERDVSVRMVLIANNDLLVYTNASTDPYTNNSGSTMLGQNQTNIDNVIGSANYDIGHVFSTGGGGVASLGVPCRNGLKARGVTGLASPIGDPFYVDYVAHEMGHQFGGNHTFNGNSGNCSVSNRNGATAYEPGSGTTVMAYAGICAPQNIQNNGDDYFHGISIDEIVAYTTLGAGNSCPVVTPTGNSAPTVNTNPTLFTIPLGTPFTLNGSATDPDGDTLTYCWEEFDLGPAGHPNAPSANAPIFRSFKGTRSSVRLFPRIQDLINNTQTLGEILPSYARTLNFRLTARDNRAGGGGVGKSATSVVVSSAGPFSVTSPNGGGSWRINSTDTVKWNVSGTDLPPVNCSAVNILLSTDGGQTFPAALVTNTPNDGAESVTVPNVLTESARVRVEAVGNIFFDISNVSFAIAAIASPSLMSPANGATNQPTSLTLRWRRVQDAVLFYLQVSYDASFSNLVLGDSTVSDTTRTFAGLMNNTLYYWRTKARNTAGQWSGWSEAWNFRTIVAPPAAPTLSYPADNALNVPPNVTFRWSGVLFATGYRLEVARDPLFTLSVIDDSSITANQATASLDTGTTYYWRVRARNAGGYGASSEVWSFRTQTLPSAVLLISPHPGAIIPPDTVRCVWRSVSTAERYWLELSRGDSLFGSPSVDSTVTDTFRLLTLPSQAYWWKVRARNAAGWGPFSEIRSFGFVITAVTSEPEALHEFVLFQNYPNPFNPTSTIQFAIPQIEHVTLALHDVLGREVSTLIDDIQGQGVHSIRFDASKLASGVYIYRLNAGGFVAVKKLVIAK